MVNIRIMYGISSFSRRCLSTNYNRSSLSSLVDVFSQLKQKLSAPKGSANNATKHSRSEPSVTSTVLENKMNTTKDTSNTKNSIISSLYETRMFKYVSEYVDKRAKLVFDRAEKATSQAVASGLSARETAGHAASAAADFSLDKDPKNVAFAAACARAAAVSAMTSLGHDKDSIDTQTVVDAAGEWVEQGNRGVSPILCPNNTLSSDQMIMSVPEIAYLDAQEERLQSRSHNFETEQSILNSNESSQISKLNSNDWTAPELTKDEILNAKLSNSEWTAVVSKDGARSYKVHGGIENKETQRFVDRIRIQVSGGFGGSGCNAFLKFHQPGKKRPDGGNGGKGGNVIIKATESLKMLSLPKRHFKGKPGAHGKGAKRHGKAGKDIIVHVPVGTVISEVDIEYEDISWDENTEEWLGGDEKEILRVVADLSEPGAEYLAAKGGHGGMGNGRFAGRQHLLSAQQKRQLYGSNSSTDVHHVQGEAPEHSFLSLEMKSIADVGLVGFPNAGKSTLIRAISRAMPKVAAYKFTTLTPHIGIINFADGFTISVADLPGLIEGAHDNKGLGHEFLRHIERTKVLLYVVDAAGSEMRSPSDDLSALQLELEKYSPSLAKKKAMVVANKLDIDPSVFSTDSDENTMNNENWENIWKDHLDTDKRARVLRDCTSLPVIPISASEKTGVRKLSLMLRALVTASSTSNNNYTNNVVKQ